MCAMRVFNVGDVLAAADVNEYLVNTILATKGSDTTRASNTTLTNDPDLSVTVAANKSYWAEISVLYTSGTPNFKVAWTVPAGANFTGSVIGVPIGGVNPAPLMNAVDSVLPITGTYHYAGLGTEAVVHYSGVLVTAGAGGSFTLQWAQDTSSALTTIVRAGSYALLRRVA